MRPPAEIKNWTLHINLSDSLVGLTLLSLAVFVNRMSPGASDLSEGRSKQASDEYIVATCQLYRCLEDQHVSFIMLCKIALDHIAVSATPRGVD